MTYHMESISRAGQWFEKFFTLSHTIRVKQEAKHGIYFGFGQFFIKSNSKNPYFCSFDPSHFLNEPKPASLDYLRHFSQASGYLGGLRRETY